MSHRLGSSLRILWTVAALAVLATTWEGSVLRLAGAAAAREHPHHQESASPAPPIAYTDIVEEPADSAPAAVEPAPVPGAATLLEMITTDATATELTVTLRGNGSLQASRIHEAEQWPPRVVIDLPNLRVDASSVLPVGIGPVRQVRVAPHSHAPPVTRVVFDLTEPAVYRVATADGSATLSLVFPLDAAPPSDVAAAQATPAESHAGTDATQPTLAAAADASAANVLIDPFAALQLVRDEPTAGEQALETLLAQVEQTAPAEPQPQAVASPAAVTPDAAELETPAEAPVPQAIEAASDTLPTTAPIEPPAATAAPPPTTAPPAQLLRVGSGQVSAQPPQARMAGQIQQQITSGGGRQYTGHPITMDFQNADLRSVLRTFAEISGLNIVIDPTVQGTVDVALTEVPWDQALDIILRANRLGYIVDGTVVRIAPLTALADEEGQRRKLSEEQALAGELVVVTRTLSYARAAALQDLITRSVLSSRGQVLIDERTNTLILTDLQSRLTTAQELIDTLDRPEGQVQIEARILEADQNYAKALGIQWGVTGRMAQDLGNTSPLVFPNTGGVSGRVGGVQGPQADAVDARALETENAGTAVNLPAVGANSAIGLTLGAINGALNLDVVLSALENQQRVRILSNPRVTTQNNVRAEIVQGARIPYQTVANNTVTTQFIDAALTLIVTPQITASGTVIMQIELANDFPGAERPAGTTIQTQRATTTVQVGDGETTVIGGIYQSTETSATERTPMLHRIPLLGWLFRNQADRVENRELLIFLTPRIVP